MKKAQMIVIGVLAGILLVVLGAVGSAVSAYNKLVKEDVGVDGQGKQVDVQYQRAFRLVPQIVNLTAQYMQNEKSVMENVTALRSGLVRAESGDLQAKDAYAAQFASFIALVGNRVENYPDLKSNQLFLTTMDEITNTENKIAMEKVRYNDRAQAYNAYRRQCCFPVLIANTFGFEEKEYIGFSDRPNQSSFGDAQL